MDVIDELIANNAAFAAGLPAQHLDVRRRGRTSRCRARSPAANAALLAISSSMTSMRPTL